MGEPEMRLAKTAKRGAKGAASTVSDGIESELFRPADVPKGAISVNVNDGLVELRGELPDQAQIDRLGDTARKITGVKDVNNLLHTGTNSG
jgi:osmotically-inducible protein OsmY